MSNVVINRDKIDILANAIADKSGYPLPMTLDELLAAVDSIKVCPQDEGGGGGGGTPELKIVRKTDSFAFLTEWAADLAERWRAAGYARRSPA